MAAGGISPKAAALIREARETFGEGQPLTRGVVALAETICAPERHDRRMDLFSAAFGGFHRLQQILAGLWSPTDDVWDAIGHASDGAIARTMFSDPYPGELPPVEGAFDAPVATPDADRVLVEIGGPIGTVPRGQVWNAVHAFGSQFALVGPGVAIVLDETNAWAMRGALTDGLQALRRHREPGA